MVLYGLLMLPYGVVRNTPVGVGIGILWVKPYGFVIVLYRSLELVKVSVCKPPVVVCIGILWVQSYGLVVLF